MTYDEARRYLLQRAQERGIDAEILTDEKRELTLGAFEGRLAETTQASQGGIGLRVVTRGKVGYASTEERSKDALEWALQEAVDNAELQSSTGGFLPEGQALGQNDLLSEGLSAPLEEKARKALELEQGLRSDPRLRQVALARYHETEQSVMLGSTRGALGGYRSGLSSLLASFVMHEGDSLKQGFEFEAAKEFHSLDPGRTSQDMLEATGRLLGARPLATGRYTAYFEPKAFTDLLRILAFMLSGKNVSEGRSRLAGRLGQRVAAAGLTLVDDPLLETGLANRPFDSEGTPAHAVTLIEDGVLQSYLHNSQTARALGQPNTGHAVRHYRSTLEVGPSNLFVRPGRGVRPDNGVIVTGMMGLHAGANPISGDLSLQAFGLLVQDGEIAHPVENFALSGNLLEMLARITGLGDTLDWKMSGFAAGAPMIEIAEVSFAGA